MERHGSRGPGRRLERHRSRMERLRGLSLGRGGRDVIRDIDAVVRRQAGQTVHVPLAHRTELPASRPPVQLPEHRRRLTAGVRHLVPRDRGAVRSERLNRQLRHVSHRAGLRRPDHQNPGDLPLDRGEPGLQPNRAALLPQQPHRTGRMDRCPVEHDVAVPPGPGPAPSAAGPRRRPRSAQRSSAAPSERRRCLP